MYEIKRFPTTPPTEAELKEAKEARVQSLPGQFETSGAIAGSIGSIFLYDRPLDYYATLPAKYEAVTAADVQRVATEDVHPDQLIIVAAGDRAKIEPQLKAADLGPVEVRDINGKLVDQK
jgi:zinc protease